jgi:Fungal specific transcription factor domain
VERPCFPGESWYLSFILQNTDNDHSRLHQPINQMGRGISPLIDHNFFNRPVTREGSLVYEGNIPVSSQPTWPPDIPPQEIRDQLVDAYFTRFHSLCPIIHKSNFLYELNRGTLSTLLLRGVLFVATIHCDARILFRMGYDSRSEASDDLFGKARNNFDSELGKDKFTMLQVSFLLHYWWGQPTFFKDTTWWLSGAINGAQAMGMNRSTRSSHMDPDRRKLWRRIWWLLYVRSSCFYCEYSTDDFAIERFAIDNCQYLWGSQ